MRELISRYSLLLTSVTSTAPSNLYDLLIQYTPARAFRFSNQHLLDPPPLNLKTFGARTFASVATALWNSLPLKLRTATSLQVFKCNLKTHLFSSYTQ